MERHVEIGPFRLDPGAEILTHDGVPVRLGGHTVAVLAAKGAARQTNEAMKLTMGESAL